MVRREQREQRERGERRKREERQMHVRCASGDAVLSAGATECAVSIYRESARVLASKWWADRFEPRLLLGRVTSWASRACTLIVFENCVAGFRCGDYSVEYVRRPASWTSAAESASPPSLPTRCAIRGCHCRPLPCPPSCRL